MDEVPEDSSTSEADKPQVQTVQGNSQVELDSGMVNHQETTKDINNTDPAKSDHNQQSPNEIENDRQSLGEKSSDNVSDKKLIESSNEEEDNSPVLGLRFTGVNTDEHLENEVNENTDEDGDLLQDNLE